MQIFNSIQSKTMQSKRTEETKNRNYYSMYLFWEIEFLEKWRNKCGKFYTRLYKILIHLVASYRTVLEL